ncbi:hypothetical protein V6N13_116276 [Hibiscus sabdariffa]|uniref:30S ribosomal protein S6 n=1 Tax=Hibiscus sabdariffa TaxID=183260 RepID=A0ABR2PCL1_9ROSI
MLDRDERVIRHLVIKRDESITKDCAPPPEWHTLRAGGDVDNDEDPEEDWDGEDEDDTIIAEFRATISRDGA